MFFNFGWSEGLLLAAVALLIFGPKALGRWFKRLGERAQGVGREFKEGYAQGRDSKEEDPQPPASQSHA